MTQEKLIITGTAMRCHNTCGGRLKKNKDKLECDTCGKKWVYV